MSIQLDHLLKRYPVLEECRNEIQLADEMMWQTYRADGKILVCGNGGSCADSDHIVGELMKGFLQKRPMNGEQAARFREVLGEDGEEMIEKLQCGIPTISLPAQSAILSAFANDVNAELVYAQMVFGYAKAGDLLIGLSTSGNSRNVVAAAKVAKVMSANTLALTGMGESKLSQICDCTVRVPESETYKIQELHLPVYHFLCASLENRIFGS